MVRNKQKANSIEQQMKEFEARLRRQMMRDKLEKMGDAFETGAMPQIHVSLGALQGSMPESRVSGD